MLTFLNSFSLSIKKTLIATNNRQESQRREIELNDRVDEGGQLDVPLAETLTVVGREGYFDPVVHVEPLRMVVHLVSLGKKETLGK